MLNQEICALTQSLFYGRAKSSIGNRRVAPYQRPIEPGRAHRRHLPVDGQVRMQLDVDPARSLSVVGVTPRHEIRGNPPSAFGFPLNNTRAAQRFQTPDMGVDDLVGSVAGISLRPKVQAMF
jgi:hypothetical protein